MTNKFNARMVSIDNILFASHAEGRRYCELKLLLTQGYITALECHPRYELIPAFVHDGKRERALHYTPDFRYVEGGRVVVEDCKGGTATRTEAYRIRRKLLLYQQPDIDFREVEA